MSNHSGSYMLRDVLELMLEKDFFEGKTDQEREEFIRGIMDICQAHDGNEGEAVYDIAEELRYCYWCRKVVPVIRKGEHWCSKCNLEETQRQLRYYTNKYGSLDYFNNKEALDRQEKIDKDRWTEFISDEEEYEKMVIEDFGEEK